MYLRATVDRGGTIAEGRRARWSTRVASLCGLVLLGGGCGSAPETAGSEDPPPNLILLVLDTTRADRLSLYGGENPTTPFLEELAADSIVYTEARSTAPWTLPSHMSIFTGLLPGEHGATMRIFDREGEILGLEQILSQTHRPTAAARMLPVLLREPFFLFLNVMDAHFPYQSPPAFRFAFGGKPELYPVVRPSELQVLAGVAEMDFDTVRPFYDASILYMDAVIRSLVQGLKRAGLYDRSLFVVTSDHGEHLGEDGRFSHQLSVEEELLHVPLLVRLPGGLRGGARDASPVSTLDIYATLLAAAGVELPRAGFLPLRDLSRADPPERRFTLAEYYDSASYLQVFRNMNPDFDVTAHRGARRVVHAEGARFVFREEELIEAQPVRAEGGAGAGARTAEAAGVWLREYTRNLPEHPPQHGAPDEGSPEFLEALRTLGYLD